MCSSDLLFDQRPVAALHFAGPSASKFHHCLVPTNFSDVAQGCDREIVVRLIEGTTSSGREREQLRGAPAATWLGWTERRCFTRFGETSLDQRIQMPAYCGTRQSEGNCQRTRGRGTRFEEDSGDASRCPGQGTGAGVGFHNLIVSYFLVRQHPRPARAPSRCNVNQAAPETASH